MLDYFAEMNVYTYLIPHSNYHLCFYFFMVNFLVGIN